MGHCIHCMITALTLPHIAGGTATTAATLHPTSWELRHLSYHTASSFWDFTSTAWALHPHSGTVQGALPPMQGHCIHLHGHCILCHNILHPPCGTLHSLHGHCIHISRHCRRHCNHCSDTESNFIGTTSSVILYCNQLVGLCFHCMGTASKFMDNAGGTATIAGSLHPVHEKCIHLQGYCWGHCNNCRIHASTFMGSASSVTTY